jgi:N-acetyl-D-muramate 6-phosphate phosphatase
MSSQKFVAPWVKAVLFDLDGTLADTAPDMAHALQKMRTDRGMPPASFAKLRARVSAGARGMVHAGFGMASDHPDFPRYRDEFLTNYAARLCVETTLYAGMTVLLRALQRAGVSWGIVTNKHQRFTLPLIEQMKSMNIIGEDLQIGTVVCGDTTSHAKPHPAPLLRAAADLNVSPDECVYVGDDIRDIQAAHAAGMPAIAALYGYLGTDQPENWNADASVNSATELAQILAVIPQRASI